MFAAVENFVDQSGNVARLGRESDAESMRHEEEKRGEEKKREEMRRKESWRGKKGRRKE